MTLGPMDIDNAKSKSTQSTSPGGDAGDIRPRSSDRTSPQAQSLFLTTATTAITPNRKGRSAETGSSQTFADRPSLSPAPPSSWRISLQQAARRPSVASEVSLSRLNLQRHPSNDRREPLASSIEDLGSTDRPVEAENSSTSSNQYGRRPSVIENSLAFIQAQTSAPDREKNRHRGSISSSIYSLGSAIINSAWPPPQSTASSVAGSDIGDSTLFDGVYQLYTQSS